MTRRVQSGFTMVELLTVIAVLALLAALLIPVTDQARMLARRSASGSNMRQIGLAIHLHAHDHHGWLPGTAHEGLDHSWIFTVSAYLDESDAVKICPGDPMGAERLARGLSSYVVNEYLFQDNVGFFGERLESFRNINFLREPGRTMMLFIGADDLPLSASNDHAHTRHWAGNWSAVIDQIQPDRFRHGNPNPRKTTGGAPYLYADGRVEVHSARQMKKWIEAGQNPARPPEATD